MKRLPRWLPSAVFGFAGFAVVLGAWEALVRVNDVSPLVLPAPLTVATHVFDHASAYAQDGWVTLREALAGFALAAAASAVLAVVMVHFTTGRRLIDPIQSALRATPIVALAPALALWLGFGAWPKVIIAALITFPPLLVNMVTGMRSIDEGALEVLRSVHASRREVLIKLRVPTAMPHVFAAAKVCVSLALIGAVVGEWAGSTAGLGYAIVQAQRSLETVTVWGAVFVLATMSIALTALVAAAERRVCRWSIVR